MPANPSVLAFPVLPNLPCLFPSLSAIFSISVLPIELPTATALLPLHESRMESICSLLYPISISIALFFSSESLMKAMPKSSSEYSDISTFSLSKSIDRISLICASSSSPSILAVMYSSREPVILLPRHEGSSGAGTKSGVASLSAFDRV